MVKEDTKGTMNLLRMWGEAYRQRLGKDPRVLCKQLMRKYSIPRLPDLNKRDLLTFVGHFMDEVKKQNHEFNEREKNK